MRTRCIHFLLAPRLTRLALFVVILCFAIGDSANATPLSGTKFVGPTGDYASITAAIADVQAQSLGGALVLELQPAYVSSVETFPLTFASLTTTSAKTLTLRPEAGATGLSITSANTTAATVDLNGAQFLTIDGRPGGTGTATQLTIANTSTSGVALRFINEASSNTLRYLSVRGVNTSVSSGTIVYSTTTGTNGNDSNTIDHCDIGDGSTTPTNGIYALGSTGTAAQNNSGNTISNCNVFNFYAATPVDSAGVRLDAGNTGWTISGNSFYQTATRAGVGAVVRAIFVNSTGNGFTVSSNTIGGGAANAGGSAWTTTGTSAAYAFVGIQLNVGTTAASSVQGNIVRNIVWTTAGALPFPDMLWSGIYLQAGTANIGTSTGNTIGSGTGTGSISVLTSGGGSPGGMVFGIASASSGTVAISNNSIGSMTTNCTATDISLSLTGIQVTAGTNTISANTIGSSTTANSLNTASTATSAIENVFGIQSSSSTSTAITNNIVANLNNGATGVASGTQAVGIRTNSGTNTITGNTIRNLSAACQINADTYVASVVGIAQLSTTAGQTVSQNVVYALANTEPTAPTSVSAIYYRGATSGTNAIARNLIHDLAVSSSDASSLVIGMQFENGAFTVQNNMIRLGLDVNGSSTAGAAQIWGIADTSGASSSGRNYYNNSIYIGGIQASGASSTFTFWSSGSTNTRAFRNNIFVNARSNSGGTGKHYAVEYSGNGANPAGLTASNNIFYTSGTGGVLGFYNTDQTSLAAWQAATGVDSSSINASPNFVNPTGDATTLDLHLREPTPADNAGVPLAAVTVDFDGETRSATTPDIGADELSSNADLGALALSAGTLSPVFASGTTSYTSSVSNSTTAETFTPTQSNGYATVTVNGGSANTPVTLNVGMNTVTIIVTAQDGTTKTYTVTITRLTTLEAWRNTYFGTTNNSGNAADTADPYGRGIQNLATFALLGPTQDPSKASVAQLPQVQMSGGNLFYSFTQPAGVTGVTYGALWSPTLATGSWLPVADTGSGTTHTFSVPIGTNTEIFMQLTATEQ